MKNEIECVSECEQLARKFAECSNMKFSDKILMRKSISLQALYFFELAVIAYEFITGAQIPDKYFKIPRKNSQKYIQ